MQKTIKGNLGGKAKLVEIEKGFLVTFNIAEQVYTKRSEQVADFDDSEFTTWYSCSYFNKDADVASKIAESLDSGMSVIVTGTHTRDLYARKNGDLACSDNLRVDDIGLNIFTVMKLNDAS